MLRLAMLVNDALLASLLLLPQDSFLRWADAPAHELTDYLLRLAARIDPKRVNTAQAQAPAAQTQGVR